MRATAFGLYPQATSSNSFAFSLAGFIASLLQPAPTAPVGVDGSRRGGLPLLQVGLSSATLLALHQLPGGVPKGYLRVLSFTEDSVLVDQRTVQLRATALNNYDTLQTGPLVVQQNGYVSVYVGNESAADVYFDDVTIEHRQGLQVQENQYDPFGLDLAGVSGAAPGLRLKNFYQFNGKERQTDLGLGWQSYGWRMYDAQLGRWHCVDQLASSYTSWSPYTYTLDNPVRYTDPDGRFVGTIAGGIIGGIVGGVRAALKHENVLSGIGHGALIGAAAGAVADLTVFTAGTGTAALVAAGALSGATGNALQQLHEKGKIDGKQVLVGAALGGVLGFAGAKAAPYLSRAASSVWNSVNGRSGSVSVGQLASEVQPYSDLEPGATLPEVMQGRPDYSLLNKFFNANIKETIPAVKDATGKTIAPKVDIYNDSNITVPEGLTQQTLELYKQQAEIIIRNFPGNTQQINRVQLINSTLPSK